MPLEEASQFLRALPIVTKKIQIIFRNGIAIIRVLEYNIISYIEVQLWNLCPQEKLLINGGFSKDELRFFALRAE